MDTRRFWGNLICMFFAFSAQSHAFSLSVSCGRYVDEGSDLECQCSAPAVPDASFRWLNHSEDEILRLTGLTRNDNGTEFVCEMKSDSVGTLNTTYTLEVAYGPTDNTTSIDGPLLFTVDGSNITLTCVTNDTNPKPYITWTYEPCNHGQIKDKCIFEPTMADNGTEINCRARNGSYKRTDQAGEATFVLNLRNPPTSTTSPKMTTTKHTRGTSTVTEDPPTSTTSPKMTATKHTRGTSTVTEGPTTEPADQKGGSFPDWKIALIVLGVVVAGAGAVVAVVFIIRRRKARNQLKKDSETNGDSAKPEEKKFLEKKDDIQMHEIRKK